ncbi:transcription factor E2F6-like [Phyllostomus hastatus]|uniref:transcription factor E2F6-like n=1 Tax=Phyllostomus hastatus TaxID=9423 RepID=UPI001E67FA45|nr:transcription factor E2F6-like [Phyllostomus hastatus]
MEIVKNSPGGVLHLKKIVPMLGIPKRRLYDITSVLHGIQMVEKVSKSRIRWIGPDISSFEPPPAQKQLREEISDLSAKERALDELIKDCAQQLFALTDDKDNDRLAYVTYQDVQSVEAYRKQTTLAIKAPPQTMLEIPAPGENAIAMRIHSTRGPIEVYLFEPKQELSSNNASGGETASASASKPPEQPDEKESPAPQSEELLEVSELLFKENDSEVRSLTRLCTVVQNNLSAKG